MNMKISTKCNLIVGFFFFFVIVSVFYSYCGGLHLCYSFPFFNGFGGGAQPSQLTMTSYIVETKSGSSRNKDGQLIKQTDSAVRTIYFHPKNGGHKKVILPGKDSGPPSDITGHVALDILRRANVSVEQANRDLYREEKVEQNIDELDSRSSKSSPLLKNRKKTKARKVSLQFHPIKRPIRRPRGPTRLRRKQMRKPPGRSDINRALKNKLANEEHKFHQNFMSSIGINFTEITNNTASETQKWNSLNATGSERLERQESIINPALPSTKLNSGGKVEKKSQRQKIVTKLSVNDAVDVTDIVANNKSSSKDKDLKLNGRKQQIKPSKSSLKTNNSTSNRHSVEKHDKSLKERNLKNLVHESKLKIYSPKGTKPSPKTWQKYHIELPLSPIKDVAQSVKIVTKLNTGESYKPAPEEKLNVTDGIKKNENYQTNNSNIILRENETDSKTFSNINSTHVDGNRSVGEYPNKMKHPVGAPSIILGRNTMKKLPERAQNVTIIDRDMGINIRTSSKVRGKERTSYGNKRMFKPFAITLPKEVSNASLAQEDKLTTNGAIKGIQERGKNTAYKESLPDQALKTASFARSNNSQGASREDGIQLRKTIIRPRDDIESPQRTTTARDHKLRESARDYQMKHVRASESNARLHGIESLGDKPHGHNLSVSAHGSKIERDKFLGKDLYLMERQISAKEGANEHKSKISLPKNDPGKAASTNQSMNFQKSRAQSSDKLLMYKHNKLNTIDSSDYDIRRNTAKNKSMSFAKHLTRSVRNLNKKEMRNTLKLALEKDKKKLQKAESNVKASYEQNSSAQSRRQSFRLSRVLRKLVTKPGNLSYIPGDMKDIAKPIDVQKTLVRVKRVRDSRPLRRTGASDVALVRVKRVESQTEPNEDKTLIRVKRKDVEDLDKPEINVKKTGKIVDREKRDILKPKPVLSLRTKGYIRNNS